MKAIELKIGNIIGLVHEYFGDMPAVVKSINECGDLCLRCLGETCTDEEYECTMNEVYPIPITEKLLTKRIGGDKVTYFISHGNSMLTFKKLDDALWDVLIQVSLPNYREIRQYVYNIQYIHQLQNAYYLATGKELEIKL